MSSHHIVRDDQEPALIIANGEACSNELLHQLLEWNPLVIVLDSAIDRVLELGIKVDVLIGDFDRDFNYNFYKEKQYPLEIIKIENQDNTDLDKAINYLINRNIPAANIVWATGKRMDHTFTNITNLASYYDQIKLVLLDDYSKIFVLNKDFRKWYPTQTILSLIPVGTVTGINSTNLEYELKNDTLILGFKRGNSNKVIIDGFVEISYETGYLLLMECND
ncbi:thiamine diphosphokinase [Flavobacterium sp. xlx-214]|uniref:thiamine diphosphokinase n=1 Tax=unclassified Flavobacterium TaxID=196869 RepID=UPI0013D5FDED|nr:MULTISPECIES: thiamine diphosphokinase [unclassified Flavobacterium]MBA5791413.1 thiamine diphosphokinase [Flavobacterium sp. xlx-221]QMI83436.1 thiamine diphosphokinase [Flavobacterium sp. xlx-214]